MMEFPLSSFAQVGSASIFPKNIGDAMKGEKKDAAVEYVTLACPVDGREFQIGIAADDSDFQSGTRRVVCPYDGTVFFPNVEKTKFPHQTGTPTLVSVVCPVDGRAFKAEVSLTDLLAGRSGSSLRCPYDGAKFRLSVQRILEGKGALKGSEKDLTTFKTPTDAKSFRAFFEEGSSQDLFSPFDGSLVSSQDIAPPSPAETKAAPELSHIEEMFVNGISSSVLKNIRQFGYDIFPEYVEGVQPIPFLPSGFAESFPFQGSTSGSFDMMRRFRGLLGSGGQGFGGLSGSGELSTIPIGPDYVVGPGDTLILNIWGSVQQTIPITVDADGKIILPKAGPVYVWGLTFSEAESLIKRTLQEQYANFNISISMGRLRTIRVFVLGEVTVPGTYYLSPQATALHALYAAYGPTKLGTLRRVKLLRADKTEEAVDLYDILIKGNNQRDLPLKANDTILVPQIGDVVGVAGRVKRPAIYETVDPLTLTQLLEMSGGLTAAGYLQRIQIERIKDHDRKVLQDFEFSLSEDLEKRGSSIMIQDGDLVTIFPITSQRHNFVSILGGVERPGDYELKEGMRLRDLLEKAGGVLPGSYLGRAELARYQSDQKREIMSVDLWKVLSGNENVNISLKEWDVLTVYSKSQVIPPKFVEIEGAVHEPGTYELTEGMHLSDLVFRAGGVRWTASLENAELFRTVAGAPSKVVAVDLQEILASGGTEKDFYLSEGDRFFIRESTANLEMGTVLLSGEFKYPGKYAIRRGEALSSVIRRAGGFTQESFLEGAVFTRENLRRQQRQRITQFLESEQQTLLHEQASLGMGYDPSQKEARFGLLEYREKILKGIDHSEFLGRMIVRLADADQLQGTAADIILEDGDSLLVPRPPSSVLVIGNVYNPIAVTYSGRNNAEYYLRKVGGLTKSADRKRVYVIKANGEAVSQFARVKRIERGDTIVVPEEFQYRSPRGLLFRDTISILYQLALGAVAVSTLD